MRKLCIAVALGLAAMAADAATNTNSVRPLGTPGTTSISPTLAAPAPPAAPPTTGGTIGGGTSGGTTTTTTTPPTTATNTALAGTLANGASLGPVTGSTTNALSGTLANSASLGSVTNAAAASATGTGTGTGTGTTTNGGVAGIVTVDNGLGGVVNGVNANGEMVASALPLNSISMGQQQVFVPTQSALTPELTALERRELRKRNNVPANKQLLNSVAPRTNVDRTWQMPDDPPSPALSTSPLR